MAKSSHSGVPHAAAVAEHLLLVKGVLEFFGLETHAELDSSAAKGMANRDRVGTVRSLETGVLLLQQAVRRGLIELNTMPSDDNLAGLGTKILRVDSLEKLPVGCGIAFKQADVVESEYGVRRLDKVDARRDLEPCLEQQRALMQNSRGEEHVACDFS